MSSTLGNRVRLCSAVAAALALLLILVVPTWAREYPAGNGTRSVIAADLDMDGDCDLAVANSYDGTVTIFSNDGGVFTAVSTVAVGNFPMGLAVGDFDADGLLDIACANYISGTVTLLHNAGSMTFAPQAEFAVGSGTMDVAFADVNGDGSQEILSADYDSGTVSVISHSSISSFMVGDGPASISVADVDGDGAMEILVAFPSLDQVCAFRLSGPSMVPAFSLSAPGQPRAVAAADLDRDGFMEIVSAGMDSGTLYVFSGVDHSRTDIALGGAGPHSVAIADVDGNGLKDIIVALSTSYTVQVVGQDTLGVFTPQAPVATGSQPLSVVAADLDGDGFGDIATANFDSCSMSVLMDGQDFMYEHAPVEIVASYRLALETVNAGYDHVMYLSFNSADLSGFTVEIDGVSTDLSGSGQVQLFGSTHASVGAVVYVNITSTAAVAMVPYIHVKNTGVDVFTTDIFCQVVSDPAGSLYAFEDLKGQDWIDWDYNDAVLSVTVL